MATFYPDLENIDRLTVPPTDGERHLLSVLREVLDESYEVYFNPYLDGDRPDTIVLKPGCGALVIEVKDWDLEHYRIDMPTGGTTKTQSFDLLSSRHFATRTTFSTCTFRSSAFSISGTGISMV